MRVPPLLLGRGGAEEIRNRFATKWRYDESQWGFEGDEELRSFLAGPIEIRQPAGQTLRCELGEAGVHLARLYASSSTSRKIPVEPQDWWLTAGCPIMYVELGHGERSFPFYDLKKREVQIPEEYGLRLSYYRVPYKGREIPAWIAERSLQHLYGRGRRMDEFSLWIVRGKERQDREEQAASDLSYFKARILRLYLLRLHAEHQCLKVILRHMAGGDIPVARGTKATETLQWYLNEATKRISRWESKSKDLIDADVAELARMSEDAIRPGQRESLLALLERENVRLNVRRKVEEYANVVVQEGATFYMADKIEQGDTYNIGGNAKVGAAGRHARVDYVDFREVWNRAGDTINLQLLADDLSRLLPELRKRAAEPTHDESVVAVGQALQAAKEKDGPKALEYLKKSGKWVFDVATDIGVKVASEAIKQVLI